MHETPIIGILGIVDDEIITKLQNTYTKAIEESGGAPILLPYVDKDTSIDAFVNLCDGFLFTGGVDVDPKHYGEDKKSTCGDVQPYRDALELKAFERIYQTKKPIMAICRGAQLVNVALGGTLYQDIPTEIKSAISHRQCEPNDAHSHKVNVIMNTPLRNLLANDRININSFHHQAIKTLGYELAVMATADDGIIEAVYSTSYPYLRAYQWHPERLFDVDDMNNIIFKDFITACQLNQTTE